MDNWGKSEGLQNQTSEVKRDIAMELEHGESNNFIHPDFPDFDFYSAGGENDNGIIVVGRVGEEGNKGEINERLKDLDQLRGFQNRVNNTNRLIREYGLTLSSQTTNSIYTKVGAKESGVSHNIYENTLTGYQYFFLSDNLFIRSPDSQMHKIKYPDDYNELLTKLSTLELKVEIKNQDEVVGTKALEDLNIFYEIYDEGIEVDLDIVGLKKGLKINKVGFVLIHDEKLPLYQYDNGSFLYIGTPELKMVDGKRIKELLNNKSSEINGGE